MWAIYRRPEAAWLPRRYSNHESRRCDRHRLRQSEQPSGRIRRRRHGRGRHRQIALRPDGSGARSRRSQSRRPFAVELEQVVDTYILEGIAAYARSSYGAGDGAIDLYPQYSACYASSAPLGENDAEGRHDTLGLMRVWNSCKARVFRRDAREQRGWLFGLTQKPRSGPKHIRAPIRQPHRAMLGSSRP
jgi:hypothetical protein